jgi:hypothetical protein
MQIDTTEQQRLDAERADTATDNRNSLIELMQRYNLLIPARAMQLWRPTERALGAIDGLRGRLEIIATDGILGWFITEEGDAWCGHIQFFDGDIKPLHSFHGPMASKSPKMKVKKKSKRQMIIDSL